MTKQGLILILSRSKENTYFRLIRHFRGRIIHWWEIRVIITLKIKETNWYSNRRYSRFLLAKLKSLLLHWNNCKHQLSILLTKSKINSIYFAVNFQDQFFHFNNMRLVKKKWSVNPQKRTRICCQFKRYRNYLLFLDLNRWLNWWECFCTLHIGVSLEMLIL